MEKIISISEAFSMQPRHLEVVTKDFYDNQVKYNSAIVPNLCKEIKEDSIQVDSDKLCNIYIGYNFDGQKIFQYLASSVNVNYEPELLTTNPAP